MNCVVKKDFKYLKGEVEIPSDKSVSHRAVILGSLSKGVSVIRNFSDGADPQSSLDVCQNLGAKIEKKGDIVTILQPINPVADKEYILDCGNSGTTMRLMCGVLAGQNCNSVLFGDESLSKRPMKRVIEPLTLMNACIDSEELHAPLKIKGHNLYGINYSSHIASAQVKSCVLLAGLFAEGVTTYTEPFLSRNHTELMLKSMGAEIKTDDLTVSIEKSELEPLDLTIFGDISSAAYFLVAGLIVPNSEITLRNVGLNPTRSGIIDVIKNMNGNIDIFNEREIAGELIGDIKVEYTPDLHSCEIFGQIIPKLIDELPVIALLATQADGETIIKDAQDLRKKESDRIAAIVTELKKLGADIEETPDGMIIRGKTPLCAKENLNSYKDHRIAMTLYLAGLITENEISIYGFDWVKISFPRFELLINSLKRT